MSIEKTHQSLISNQLDVSGTSKANQEFQAALDEQDPEKILDLLKNSNIDINLVDQNGNTVLFIAAENPFSNEWGEVMNILLEKKPIKWDHVNNEGNNIFHKAENSELTEKLINKCPANLTTELINAKNKDDQTPFSLNCNIDRGDATINALFVEKTNISPENLFKGACSSCEQQLWGFLENFDLSKLADQQKNELLFIACQNDNEDFLNALVSLIDFTALSDDGRSPFVEIVKRGNPETVANMLEKMDSSKVIEIANKFDLINEVLKFTSIELSSSKQDENCAKLIERGLIINPETFMEMCSQNYSESAREALKQNNDLKNSIDANGSTPLILGSAKMTPKLVEELVAGGVDINHKNNENQTAFNLSLASYNFSAASELLNSENLELVNYNGLTPLELTLALAQNVADTEEAQWDPMVEVITKLIGKSSPEQINTLIDSLKLAPSKKEELRAAYKTGSFEGMVKPLVGGGKGIAVKLLENIVQTPVSEELRASADKLFKSLKENPVKYNPKDLGKYQLLVKDRVKGSVTLATQFEREVSLPQFNLPKNEKTSIEKPMTKIQGWKQCDQKMRDLALNKQSMTKGIIREINQLLRPTEPKDAGIFREKGEEIRAGNRQTHSYVLGEMVEAQVDQFTNWLDSALEKCDNGQENPLIVAAQASQWLVSIHPFSDGNGRTSRMVMDYILQRHDLPPASIGDNVENGIFPLIHDFNNPSDSVQMVLEGINNSMRIITGES